MMRRRVFLALPGAVPFASCGRPSATTSSAGPRPFELDEATFATLHDGLKSGKYSSRALTEKYLARIDEIDRNGPALKSVIEINPDALSMAGELDRERREKGARGPLHGLPILLKDNIDTGDRMMTSAGSLALADAPAPRDSFVAQRLRAAGAVILGKTNLSEWANIRSSRSSSGWSARGGQTKNPYILDRNPSGSSSGSGVAVAASLCAAAIGTETDGSIVSPSSLNGIVGIKPTVGLVGRSGIVPISDSQDTAGPMARTVTDAALLLGAIAGADPQDAATSAGQGRRESGFSKYLRPDALKGARLGVARQLFGFNEHVDRLMASTLDTLKQAGAELIDPIEFDSFGKMGDAEIDVLLYELKADVAAYLAARGATAKVHSLREIIEFNKRHAQREMPIFGQDLFEKAESKGPLTDKTYVEALQKCRKASRTDGIDAAMAKHRLDAIVSPTDGPAWVTDWANGDHFSGGSSTYPAVAGYPHITVPAGQVFGLPVGLSFYGRPWSEGILVGYAFAFEQAVKARRAPRFLPPGTRLG